ncbi:RNA-binding protein 28 isoform X2 [Triplophysa dalaica]|uniref:RNA-binding protein 28 isoform X2 n=1 Tax=Triplophysa dalaica TaxID=1582913 RepID=UPI0024DF4CE6|nr:RNA-binding protein 28 isoform X2 [Triplophysa dalaica]
MPAVTLFVKRLPASATNEHLGEIFSEVGPLKNSFVVKEKGTEKCRGIGYVTFSMEDDAQRALKEVKEYDGQKIVVVLAKKKPDDKKRRKTKIKEESEEKKEEIPKEPAESQQKFQGMRKNKLKARLIVRNLSFKCTEDDLKQIFSEFGVVLEAKIPLKPDGKMRGFAFVQFQNMPQAAKALAAKNMKEIKGRQVAVDWAISKDKYIATQEVSSAESQKDVTVKAEDAEPINKQGSKNKPTLHQKTADSESEEDSEEDDESDDGDDEDEQDCVKEEEEEENESKEIDSEDEDDDEDSEYSDEESDGPPKKKICLPSDVNEGRTIFIRNLSFDIEEEDLEEVLLQFGEMNYVKVVMHASTGHSKGCAFAQFKTKEAAEKCVAAAQNENESVGIRLDGRKVYIVSAVSRDDAGKFKDKKLKTHKGIRNLYLSREGLIRPGSNAAEGVSESDMAKRIRFQELKRQKLKDVSLVVSKTRLCVHNLPKRLQRPQFRKISLKAAGDKGAHITECRVMYDKKPVRGQVMGQSLGYGFVEFKEEEHALQALRHLNNNPDIFGAQKRPIVEFALEDTRKLKLKARRLENSKKKAQKEDASCQEEGKTKHSPGKKPNNSRQAGIMGNVGKQEKAQGSKYSGFMTQPEVEHVDLPDGKKRQKVLPMPSHSGPKIRKRDKGKQPVQPKKLKKAPSRKERNMSSLLEKPNQNMKQNAKPAKRKIRNREDDRFDSLVEQYKKKLLGNSNAKTQIKKSKWFS